MNTSVRFTIIFCLIAVVTYLVLNTAVHGKPIYFVRHTVVNGKQRIGKVVILFAMLAVYTVLFLKGRLIKPYLILLAFGLRYMWDGICEKQHGCNREVYLDSFTGGIFFLVMSVVAVLFFR